MPIVRWVILGGLPLLCLGVAGLIWTAINKDDDQRACRQGSIVTLTAGCQPARPALSAVDVMTFQKPPTVQNPGPAAPATRTGGAVAEIEQR
ncbi:MULTISPECIES: hypothetical protein [Bradyrhizobium]|uniref:Uncharacterized protein n=1 Tax=Bradyrhizobium denitrificans TaxID=2734912 RepID=A0ABS5G193_9BRAD|nr:MULTISPECIES: hypothetical protein [Bradyrhizobium]RTM03211.1 MAG: hypothetical protein EKK32_09090 [Bradyrhizobiaceae bacterium]MBR1135063.1 hypothetical protein [Bradyrhizobium denitrificans]MCL8484740.1 hypothetical protein [Bradyrhizobium denitrificans]MDU0959101.1 hypothetical protein [Bradyrhizobium sp.]MDU1493949.1 hypothetical protein [Bradyrhizobium sp.]